MTKFVNKDFQYKLTQPGSEILFFNTAQELLRAKKQLAQSEINCGKSVLCGGFNPNDPKEVDQIENEISLNGLS